MFLCFPSDSRGRGGHVCYVSNVTCFSVPPQTPGDGAAMFVM